MTEEQYDLCERMENEYADYIDALLKEGKQTIISMSDKTTFFAQMLSYIKERNLPQTRLNVLHKTATPLNDLYLCYMNNNEDYLQYARTAAKVLYQYVKEQKAQSEM